MNTAIFDGNATVERMIDDGETGSPPIETKKVQSVKRNHVLA